MITVKIIADSINPCGNRLTTFVVTLPRILLAELNTHRAFSRNSASSRAIPFSTMLESLKNNPFIPLRFQKDHKGMQGTEYYEGGEHEQCVKDWLSARDKAVEAATSFSYPVTKQLRNRLLEPFLWHTVIISATEFENFFALRAHPDAEIHIADLAEKMLVEYNNSVPKKLGAGEWHIPFGDSFDDARLFALQTPSSPDIVGAYDIIWDKIKISTARCARISYNSFEGKDDYVADIKLHNKLVGSLPLHMSPTEHIALTCDSNVRIGNFNGFKQYRYFFDHQNASDPRVMKNNLLTKESN